MEQYKYDAGDDRFHIDLTGQIRMEMAGMVDCPVEWAGHVHCHPFWELVFINTGSGEIRLGNTALPFAQGALFLVPPLETHQFANRGRGRLEIFYIGFGSELQALGHYDADVAPVLRLDAARDLLMGRLARLVETIKTAKSGVRSYHDQALLFEIVYNLVVFLQENPGAIRDLSEGRDGLIAERAKRYLDSNVHRTISVEEVAAKFYLSPHYFAKKFRDEAGMGIKEYHNKARMVKALELLKDPLLSVSQVAAKLGYDQVTYFTNRFREFHGVTPTAARRPAA